MRRSEEARLPFDRMLDALEAPVLLVAGSGTVLHASPSARARHDPLIREALAHGPGRLVGERALRALGRVVPMPMFGRTTWLVQLRKDPGALPLPLSPALRQVANAAIGGATNERIADDLGLTDATVRTYLDRAYRALGVHSRAELIARWGTRRRLDALDAEG